MEKTREHLNKITTNLDWSKRKLFFLIVQTILILAFMFADNFHALITLGIASVIFLLSIYYLIWYTRYCKNNELDPSKPITFIYDVFFAGHAVYIVSFLLSVLTMTAIPEFWSIIMAIVSVLLITLRVGIRFLSMMGLTLKELILGSALIIFFLLILANLSPSTWTAIPLFSTLFLFFSSDEWIVFKREEEACSKTKEYYAIKRKLVRQKVLIIILPLTMYLSLLLSYCGYNKYNEHTCALLFKIPGFSQLCGLGWFNLGFLRLYIILILGVIIIPLILLWDKRSNLSKELESLPSKKYY